MILTNSIEIKIHHLSLTNYLNHGYKVNVGDIISVPPEHLPKNSHEKIEITCDGCQTKKEIQYRVYARTIIKNEKHEYFCNKCNKILREKTNMKKYGVDNVFKKEEIKKKWRETVIEKYGVDHPCKTEKIKNKIFNTNLKNYGVKYLMLNDEIKNKSTKTCIEKYGGNSSFCSLNVRKKQETTMIEKYGYKCVFNNKEKKKDIILSKNKSTIKKYKNLIEIEDTNYKILCEEKNHIFDINIQLFHERKNRNLTLCTICNPIGTKSGKELELKKFIKNNYNGLILENNRKIIKPYEIDIFLPELKLGFEFNGLFWHSDKFKSSDYHKTKQNLASENNINLFSIYEDEWLYKKEIVKNNILKLIKSHTNIEISQIKKEIYNQEIEVFIENNSIYSMNKKHNFLCLYDIFDNLVEVISFIYDNKQVEIFNICEKIGIKADINNIKKYFSNKTILLHSKKDWNIFTMLEKVCEIEPVFSYIIKDKRSNILCEHKYKIYDSGEIIYNL